MEFARNGKRHLLRRLRTVGIELAAARSELTIANEQHAALQESDDEAHIKMLVSENRFDEKQWDQTHRHAEVMQRAIDIAAERVRALEAQRDELIGRLVMSGVTNVADILEG